MKKLLAIILAGAMILSLAACGDSPETPDTAEADVPALELLNAVWDALPEENKPMAFGGDYHEENQVENAPGVHSIETDEDAQSLDTNFGLPASDVSMVSAVACIRHMLNANTFSCAAYEVTDAENVGTVAEAIRDGLMNRAYMCGWPEQLDIYSVGNTVVCFFGALDIVNTFKDALGSVYGDGCTLYYEEDMSEAGGDNTFAFPVPNGDDPA